MNFDMMQASAAQNRSTAMTRRTAMHRGIETPKNNKPPSIAAFGGFAVEDDGPNPDDWFENKEGHEVLAGPFTGV